MKPLTLKDKRTLRRMLADACNWQERTNASYVEAAEVAERYEKVLAKIVPRGPLPSSAPDQERRPASE